MEEQYHGRLRNRSPRLKVPWKPNSSPQAKQPAKSPGLKSSGRILSLNMKHQRCGVTMKLPLLSLEPQSIITGPNTLTFDISLFGTIWSKGGGLRFNIFLELNKLLMLLPSNYQLRNSNSFVMKSGSEARGTLVP